MNRKQSMLLSVAALLMISVFLVVGAVLAAPITGDNECGKGTGEGFGLRVKKDVFCEMDRVWDWDINKTVDESNLTLSLGQQHTVNYTITASATSTSSNFGVSGNISILNTTSETIVIESVGDSLAPVNCGVSFPFALAGGFSLACTYDGSIGSAAAANVATVTVASGGDVTATAPIDWTQAAMGEIDECAVVTDSFAGTLGTVCAGASTSFTFTYPRTIGPYDVCGDYTVNNTASFVTNDIGSTGSDGAAVNVSVPCAGGCTLTPGYWKTHSSYGPAPYDSTWALLGENTTFFFSGKSYYQALWTSPGGNAYYILAHAYIAAKLNQLNGANFSAAQAAFDQATVLFSNPTNTPAYVATLRGEARATWISLAETLDNYNNGLIGPGHCDE